MDALFALAVHGTDTKTTHALQCVSKDLHNQLEETDLWRTKFAQKYPMDWYRDWWTAKENYLLQEKGGLFEVAITTGDCPGVDHVLYKKCPRHARLVSLSNKLIHHGMGYSAPKMVTLDLRQALGKYIVLCNIDYEGMHIVSSFSSLQKAGVAIKEIRRDTFAEYKDKGIFLEFCVLDLSTLILEYSLPEDVKESYFWNVPRVQFWITGFDEDDGEEEVDKFCSTLNAAQ